MKKPFVICIAGGSASGKSTFADKLESVLSYRNIALFHMDAYFKPENERPAAVSPTNGKTYRDDNHPDSFRLEALLRDVKNAAGTESGFVIVEGLLTLWYKPLRELADLKIFIDCRADERIVRRLKRNMTWGLTFDEIADVYLALVRFRHDEYVEPSREYADLVIDGSKPFDIESFVARLGLAK